MTRNYPALIPLHNLQKKNVNGDKYIKSINVDLLEFINPISIAYWAMVDGSFSPNGFYFHTEAFTFKECYLLASLFQY